MKVFSLIICCIVVCSSGYGQQRTQQVIAAAGGTDHARNISLDWTLGEVAVQTLSTPEKLYTQGFHQPVLVVKAIASPHTLIADNYSINIAPNPVQSVLNILIETSDKTPLRISLVDASGKRILNKSLPGGSQKAALNLTENPAGTYILQVLNTSGELIKTFKVVKQ